MTLAETTYASLRRDIVQGVFPSGGPLRLAALSERYGVGFSPLREALSRLQAERLVTAESLRGFRVAPLSAAEFEDALSARLLIETAALRDAIQRGGDDWAAAIVAALYALKLQAGRPGGDLQELQTRHHAFHRALLTGCGSDWMLEFFERLYAATERYRLMSLTTEGAHRRDIEAEHTAIAEAALAREADKAADLLRDHYVRTAETIRARLRNGPAATGGPDSKARRHVTPTKETSKIS